MSWFKKGVDGSETAFNFFIALKIFERDNALLGALLEFNRLRRFSFFTSHNGSIHFAFDLRNCRSRTIILVTTLELKMLNWTTNGYFFLRTEYRISSKNLIILLNLFSLFGRQVHLEKYWLTLLLRSKQGGAKNIFLHEIRVGEKLQNSYATLFS